MIDYHVVAHGHRNTQRIYKNNALMCERKAKHVPQAFTLPKCSLIPLHSDTPLSHPSFKLPQRGRQAKRRTHRVRPHATIFSVALKKDIIFVLLYYNSVPPWSCEPELGVLPSLGLKSGLGRSTSRQAGSSRTGLSLWALARLLTNHTP